MDESDATAFSPSDLPPYTASPTDTMHGTRMLTKREKQEKQEKKEESDQTDRDTTKVELYSGEEGVSSRSPAGSPIVVSRTACPYAKFDSDRSDSSGDTVPIVTKKARRTSHDVTRESGKNDRLRGDGRKTRGENKRDHPQRHGRSGGRRTSRRDKEKEPRRPVRRRAVSDSTTRRRRRKDDHRPRGRTPKRRTSRMRRISSPRQNKDRPPVRVFSASSEGDTPASSSGLPRVFLPNEYLENETGFWTKRAKEGEAVVREFSGSSSDEKPNVPPDILANRECTLITRESLLKRGPVRRAKEKGARIVLNESRNRSEPGRGTEDGDGKKPKGPFQRFRPTVTSKTAGGNSSRLSKTSATPETAVSRNPKDALGAGIPPKRARGAENRGSRERPTEVESSAGNPKRVFATSMPPPSLRSRIRIGSGTSGDSGAKVSGYLSKSGACASGVVSDPKVVYRDPASVAVPQRRRKPKSTTQGVSGETGSEGVVGTDDVPVGSPASSGEGFGRRRNLTSAEIRAVESASSLADQQALTDADALWRMFAHPVYGDPICPEEEFSELSVRYAKKGFKWVRLASAYGVTLANRRIRSENRAFHGYGLNKPTTRAPSFYEQYNEYDQAKKRYLDDLMNIFQTHEGAVQPQRLLRFPS